MNCLVMNLFSISSLYTLIKHFRHYLIDMIHSNWLILHQVKYTYIADRQVHRVDACMGPFLRLPIVHNYLTVTLKCAENWTDIDGINRLCEDRQIITPETVTALYSTTGKLYRNKYCAECNYISLNEVTFIKLDANCPVRDINRIQRNATKKELLEYVYQMCSLTYQLPDTTPLHVVTGNICHDNEKVIDYCKYGSQREKESLCEAYSSPVNATLSNNKSAVYKNIHCAECQGLSVIKTSCPISDSRFSPDVSMKMLLDITSGVSEISNGCDDDQVYDEISKTCREVICPPMFQRVKNGCKSISAVAPNTQMLPYGPTSYQVIITINTILSHMDSISNIELNRHIENELSELKQYFNDSGKLKNEENCLNTLNDYAFSYSKYVHELINETCFVIDMKGVGMQNNILHYTVMIQKAFRGLQATINATSLIFVNHDIFTEHSCPKGDPKSYFVNSTHIENDTVHINENKFDSSNVLMGMALAAYEKSQTINSTVWVTICKADHDDCPMVSFSLNEYVKTNESVLLKDSGVILNGTDYLNKNGTVFVCIEKLNFLAAEQYVFFAKSSIQGWMTMIGSSLSISCLLLTLIVYSLLSSLRTLPGKCIMSLSLSLLLAQLLLELNLYFTTKKLLCKAVAMGLHFFWLASFAWMAILSFDISQTFAEKSTLKSEGQKLVLFKKYTLLATMLPIGFVTTCLLIDVLTDLPFQYGGTNACWIGGNEALLYSFALPVALAIVLNVFFFMRAVCGIIKTTKLAKKATKDKSDNNQIILYAKMSTLMGFTWVFGFLAALTKVQELWYLFIAFNSLQGVFISMSFTFTVRVLKLMRQRLGLEPASSGKTTATSISRSSQSQKENSM